MEQKDYSIENCETQRIAPKKFYQHLTETDRKNLERFLRLKQDKNYKGPKITYEYIGQQLGIHKSTVSREIKRGLWNTKTDASGRHYEYRSDVGQRVAKERSNRKRQRTKLKKGHIALERLTEIINREKTSPYNAFDLYEQHYGEKFPISLKTFYKYLRRRMVNVKPSALRRFSFAKPKKAPKVGKRIQKGDNIAMRPQEAEMRLEIGHWEGDTIIGKRGTKACSLTLVDRCGRIVLGFKIPDRSAESVKRTFDGIEKKIGSSNFVKLFRTLTLDNSSEFSDVSGIEKSALEEEAQRIKLYFANAYHSWERGTNENANGWIRYYFPKGTDFSSISEKRFQKVINKINFSKRRILGGISAAEFCKRNNPELFQILELLGFSNPFLNMGSYLDKIA
jgi:IS30 family transposase